MNKSWQQFKLETSINEIDLWDDNTALDKRSLTNARLYPYISLYLDKDEMSSLSQYFWIDLMSSSQKSILVKKWRESSRLSLENVFAMLNYEQLFTRRRRVFNTINVKFLVEHVIENKSIQFNSLIRSAVYDGYANEILKSFDKGNSKLIFFWINSNVKINLLKWLWKIVKTWSSYLVLWVLCPKHCAKWRWSLVICEVDLHSIQNGWNVSISLSIKK